jgi:hypothetical protein
MAKRQKVQGDRKGSAAPVVRQSKIFAPFRVSFTVLGTNS